MEYYLLVSDSKIYINDIYSHDMQLSYLITNGFINSIYFRNERLYKKLNMVRWSILNRELTS